MSMDKLRRSLRQTIARIARKINRGGIRSPKLLTLYLHYLDILERAEWPTIDQGETE